MGDWERTRWRTVAHYRLLIGAGAGMAAVLTACGGDSSGENGGSSASVDPGAGGATFSFGGYLLKADPGAAITAVYTPAGSYNAAATLDTEERKKIYSEVQRKGAEQVLAYWPIAHGIQYAHTSKKVGNLHCFGSEAKDRYANLWI